MAISSAGNFPPLFCVYGEPLKLALKLRKKRPVYSLNTAYGVGGISTAPSDISEAADIYIKAIQSVQSDGPYFLYGHCSGAAIAYEIAMRLLADAHEVSHVFMLEPSFDTKGMKQTAVIIIKSIISTGITLARFKALLSVSGLLLRSAPVIMRNNIQLVWSSVLGTVAPQQLRFDSQQRKIAPSVKTYIYTELGCPVSLIYRNLDNAEISQSERYWEKVVGHKVRVYSVDASGEHLAVLADAPLQSVAAVIDRSIDG